MRCTNCGAEVAGGAFCTACGQALSTESPAATPPAPATRKKVWLIVGVVVAVLVAGGAAALVLLTRESPAAPLLRQMCRDMEDVNLQKTRLADDKSLEASLRDDLAEATRLDAEAALPFRDTVDYLASYIKYQDKANDAFSEYLLYSSISSTSPVARNALNEASDALDDAKEEKVAFEDSVATNCALWPPVS